VEELGKFKNMFVHSDCFTFNGIFTAATAKYVA
jgi:hypothetical protein